jgi:hypothetical protein
MSVRSLLAVGTRLATDAPRVSERLVNVVRR